MGLCNYFGYNYYKRPTHNWLHYSHDGQKVPIDLLAECLAVEIVKFRCRRCPQHFQAWKNKVEFNVPLSDSSQKALLAFLVPTFGDPENDDNHPNIDHLEGFVGEWLWYFLSIENPSEIIIHAVPPGFKSTDPGGDALIIHRVDGQLFFRLWEMKKFAPKKDGGKQQLSATVGRAYAQLNTRALEYLARITATEQELDDTELEEFIGMLPDLWVDASSRAAAGVSVATSNNLASQNCFYGFGQQFPRFVSPVRLLGMLTGVEDFSTFAIKVKEYIWKGL